VQLSFIVPQEEVKYWRTLISDFEAQHPHIRIVLAPENPNRPVQTHSQTDFTTDEREAIYALDIRVGSAKYDLVYMDIIWAAQFQDYLVDLEPLIERDEIDLTGFMPGELEAGKFNGQQYRLPMRSDIGLLYYRKDQWKPDSQPSGLAELAERIEQVKAASPNNQGYLWQGGPYEGLVANFIEAMSSFDGAFWIEPQSHAVGLTQPATLAAATALQQLVQQGISPEAVTDFTEQSSLAAFQTGQSAVLRGWPYFATELQPMDWNRELGIAPPFAFSSQPSKGCRGGWGFGIPRNAAHKAEAWEAVKFFTSEASQKTFTEASGYLPSRTVLFNHPAIAQKYPHIPELLTYMETASAFRPALREYDDASKILQTALSQILREQGSVEQIMARAQQETERLLRSE